MPFLKRLFKPGNLLSGDLCGEIQFTCARDGVLSIRYLNVEIPFSLLNEGSNLDEEKRKGEVTHHVKKCSRALVFK